ncbi:DoxX family protein [Nocardia sp. NPDC050406]|uniref:DoxX family protein n=1 Tax=Nocardia sp. NPDC050406 TaxID=3364318 RepID=UPI0037A01B2E
MNNTVQSARRGRALTVLFWIVTGLLLVELVYGGYTDVVYTDQVEEVLDRLGYSHDFSVLLGIAKWLAAVVILLPRLPRWKEWAYAGVVFIDGGAVYSHIAAGDGFSLWLPPLLFGLLTLLSWALRPPSRRDPAPLPEVRGVGALFPAR